MQFSASGLTKESIFTFASTTSLLLTIVHSLWPKFAETVALIWHDMVAAGVAIASLVL